MTNTSNSETGSSRPTVYEVRIKGHLGPDWADWFEGAAVSSLADGDTLLVGPMVDQAALHAVLRRVRDLGLTLVSVRRLQATVSDT